MLICYKSDQEPLIVHNTNLQKLHNDCTEYDLKKRSSRYQKHGRIYNLIIGVISHNCSAF